jgi:hypothetical protein
MMKKPQTLLTVVFSLIFTLTFPDYFTVQGAPAGPESPSLADLSFRRPVKLMQGAKRALVMMVTHESFEPSAVDTGMMQKLMEETSEIFSTASRNTLHLESIQVPEPVFLPGNSDEYHLSKVRDLYAAANKEVLAKYGKEMDSETFEVWVYFFPTDTNDEPFGMGKWNSTFGLRYVPAVVNIGTGTGTRPEAIAHEMGHAFFEYAHAGSADLETGKVLKPPGDPYELMGYGLNMNLVNPPHVGLIYRYYWGWADEEEITLVTDPGLFQLDSGKALLIITDKNTPLWLELISEEQAYEEETGGLLVRIDGSGGHAIHHRTLDMTPETGFQADMHMVQGQTILFEGCRITYVRRTGEGSSESPGAEIKIEK